MVYYSKWLRYCVSIGIATALIFMGLIYIVPHVGATPTSTTPINLESGVSHQDHVGADEQDFYKISVNDENAIQLEVKTTGTTGDALDLYIKFGTLPTVDNYDLRSYTYSGDETIVITSSSSPPLQLGEYYILVDGWDGGDYVITAIITVSEPTNNNNNIDDNDDNPVEDTENTEDSSASSSPPSQPQVVNLTLGVEVAGSLATSDALAYYKVIIMEATNGDLAVRLDGPELADFDLYIKKDVLPTHESYDARGYTTSADETIIINNPTPGTYYIMVHAYDGVGSFTLIAVLDSVGDVEEPSGTEGGSESTSIIELMVDTPVTGSLDATHDKKYYNIFIDSGEKLTITLDGPPGVDFDLYVRHGNLPTTSNYDVRGYTSSADETCTIPNPSGEYYIMVHSYSGSGSYTIRATIVGTLPDDNTGEGSSSDDSSGTTPPTTLDPNGDEDQDGLINSREHEIGTDPYNPDTDGDGFWDAIELNVYRTNPLATQFDAETSRTPWSGYWWPLADKRDWGGEIENLYDEGGPLDKYDQYVNKTRGYNPGAREWEYIHKRYPKQTLREAHAEKDYERDFNHDGDLNDSYDLNGDGDTEDEIDASWWGHCHAWASAAILEEEPREPVTIAGITFTVGDLKGLLVACYDCAWDVMFVGTRYDAFEKDDNGKLPRYDSQGDDVMDVTPKDFHLTLLKYIARNDLAIVMDITATGPVWNYPAYKYQMTMTTDPEHPDTKHVTCKVWFVTDGVSVNYVGASTFTKTYYYYLNFSNGDIVDSGWERTSKDYNANDQCHPDFIWRVERPGVEWGNPLRYEIVREILSYASSTEAGSRNSGTARNTLWVADENDPRAIAPDAPDASKLNLFPTYEVTSTYLADDDYEDNDNAVFVDSGPEVGKDEPDDDHYAELGTPKKVKEKPSISAPSATAGDTEIVHSDHDKDESGTLLSDKDNAVRGGEDSSSQKLTPTVSIDLSDPITILLICVIVILAIAVIKIFAVVHKAKKRVKHTVGNNSADPYQLRIVLKPRRLPKSTQKLYSRSTAHTSAPYYSYYVRSTQQLWRSLVPRYPQVPPPYYGIRYHYQQQSQLQPIQKMRNIRICVKWTKAVK